MYAVKIKIKNNSAELRVLKCKTNQTVEVTFSSHCSWPTTSSSNLSFLSFPKKDPHYSPRSSHKKLPEWKWLLPWAALKVTRHLRAAGVGWWWAGPSSLSASPTPSPSPSPSSLKRSRRFSTWPAARCLGSPPSCWLSCTAEVSCCPGRILPSAEFVNARHLAHQGDLLTINFWLLAQV